MLLERIVPTLTHHHKDFHLYTIARLSIEPNTKSCHKLASFEVILPAANVLHQSHYYLIQRRKSAVLELSANML